MATAKEKIAVTPDRKPIGELQAQRLAAVSGLNVKEIVGSNVAEA